MASRAIRVPWSKRITGAAVGGTTAIGTAVGRTIEGTTITVAIPIARTTTAMLRGSTSALARAVGIGIGGNSVLDGRYGPRTRAFFLVAPPA